MRQPRTITLALCAVLLMAGCQAGAPDDNAIKAAIEAKLYQDSVLSGRGIQVDSQQGVVTLTGNVNSDAEKSLAEQLFHRQIPVFRYFPLLVLEPAPVLRLELVGESSGLLERVDTSTWISQLTASTWT